MNSARVGSNVGGGARMKDLPMTSEDQQEVSTMWKRHLLEQQQEVHRNRARLRNIRLPGLVLASLCGLIGMLNITAGSAAIFEQAASNDGRILLIIGLSAILLALPLHQTITAIRSSRLSAKGRSRQFESEE
jgi:hypothetical protein